MGKALAPGEESKTGLYAIMASRKDWPLRISLFKELAAEMEDPEWRYIAECHILRIEKL
jgi:hypothetical protein